MLSDSVVNVIERRMKGVNDVWRLCNSACVSANLIEHNCDFTYWQDTWHNCMLRTWTDRAGAEKLNMKVDPEDGCS